MCTHAIPVAVDYWRVQGTGSQVGHRHMTEPDMGANTNITGQGDGYWTADPNIHSYLMGSNRDVSAIYTPATLQGLHVDPFVVPWHGSHRASLQLIILTSPHKRSAAIEMSLLQNTKGWIYVHPL